MKLSMCDQHMIHKISTEKNREIEKILTIFLTIFFDDFLFWRFFLDDFFSSSIFSWCIFIWVYVQLYLIFEINQNESFEALGKSQKKSMKSIFFAIFSQFFCDEIESTSSNSSSTSNLFYSWKKLEDFMLLQESDTWPMLFDEFFWQEHKYAKSGFATYFILDCNSAFICNSWFSTSAWTAVTIVTTSVPTPSVASIAASSIAANVLMLQSAVRAAFWAAAAAEVLSSSTCNLFFSRHPCCCWFFTAYGTAVTGAPPSVPTPSLASRSASSAASQLLMFHCSCQRSILSQPPCGDDTKYFSSAFINLYRSCLFSTASWTTDTGVPRSVPTPSLASRAASSAAGNVLPATTGNRQRIKG